MKSNRILITATLGLALILTGCSKKETAQDNSNASQATTAKQGDAGASKAGDTPASGREIEITGNDTMKFSMTEIRAKAGESLTVTLVNIGSMPKFSMGHNWVLLKKDTDFAAFVEEAAQAPTTDYIPQGRKNDILAHTKLLGPKQTDSVTFQAPKEAGRYVFLCSFPGHFQVGMKGELIVE
jgi:azurin